MKIEELLRQHKSEILDRWRTRIAETYPAETATFLRDQPDRFRNPVGHTVSQVTADLFDALLQPENPEGHPDLLEPLIRIRAVQDLTPAQAIGFVFDLKTAVREELAGELRTNDLTASLLTFESQVDALALIAFDCYMACREQIYRLRSDEVKRQTQSLVERAHRLRGNGNRPVEETLQP